MESAFENNDPSLQAGVLDDLEERQLTRAVGAIKEVDRHRADCAAWTKASEEVLKAACEPGSKKIVMWIDFGSNLLMGKGTTSAKRKSNPA